MTGIRTAVRAFALCAVVWGLAGCALVDRHVRLTYPAAAADARPADEAGLQPVAVVVTEGRAGDLTDVGSIRDGLYIAMADVRTTDDAAAWVRGAAEREFPTAGLRVVPEGSASAKVGARIMKVDADAYFTYWADVVLECELTSAAGRTSLGTVHGEGGAGLNMTATEASFQESLALAVQDAARKLAAKVRDALTPQTPHP